jgi:hypothetical protein
VRAIRHLLHRRLTGLPDVRDEPRDRLGRRRRAVGWLADQLVELILRGGDRRYADRARGWAVSMGINAAECRAAARLATVWLVEIVREALLAEAGEPEAVRLLASLQTWRAGRNA